MTAYRSLRALSALALAASVAGCSFDTFTGESGEAVDAVARLVDLMEGGDYDGAQAEACPDEADVTAASLRYHDERRLGWGQSCAHSIETVEDRVRVHDA
jgi:hypothetical protein